MVTKRIAKISTEEIIAIAVVANISETMREARLRSLGLEERNMCRCRHDK